MTTYKIVPLEEVIATSNPLELDLYSSIRETIKLSNITKGGIPMPQLDVWNYAAYHKHCDHRSIGSSSFSAVLSDIEKSLKQYQPFTGLILHGYRLSPTEQEQVMHTASAPLVALIMEPPAVTSQAQKMKQIFIESGGVIMEFGGPHRLHIVM